jgi:hypothetical protein
MPNDGGARPPARARGGRSVHRRFGLVAGAIAGASLAAACAALPPAPIAGADPADPRAAAKPVAYRSTTAPYTSLRPVEPGPWREQNERVAPVPQR